MLCPPYLPSPVFKPPYPGRKPGRRSIEIAPSPPRPTTRDYPLVVARGEGCSIEDVDGNIFLHMTAGIAVTATGHCHPAVVRAIQEQAGQLIHMSGTDFYDAPMVELAERLAGHAPIEGEARVFFTNSGAESNEGAIKLVPDRSGDREWGDGDPR